MANLLCIIHYIVVLVDQNLAHNHRFTLIFLVPLILSRITRQSPPIGPLSPPLGPPPYGGGLIPPHAKICIERPGQQPINVDVQILPHLPHLPQSSTKSLSL